MTAWVGGRPGLKLVVYCGVHIGVPATFSLLKRLQAHLKGKKSPFAHHKIKENLNLHTLTQVATLGLDRAKITKVPDPLDPWEHLDHDQADQPSPPGSGQALSCPP